MPCCYFSLLPMNVELSRLFPLQTRVPSQVPIVAQLSPQRPDFLIKAERGLLLRLGTFFIFSKTLQCHMLGFFIHLVCLDCNYRLGSTLVHHFICLKISASLFSDYLSVSLSVFLIIFFRFWFQLRVNTKHRWTRLLYSLSKCKKICYLRLQPVLGRV